jgi:elongation factor Ts
LPLHSILDFTTSFEVLIKEFMMDIDVETLKLLRKKSGAGMLDCRKALAETKGDAAVAEALLKERGLASVEKREGRSMEEGRIFSRASGSRAAMAELSCETDFVSLNEAFREAGAKIVDLAFEKRLSAPDIEIQGLVAELGRVFKENIALRRLVYIEGAADERIGAYIHGDGRIGALVLAKADRAISGGGAAFEEGKIASFLHDLALHVAAFKPLFLDEASVPDAYKSEKIVDFRRQVEEDDRMRGKSAAILEGAVAGKMRKHLVEVCLLSHGFVKDEAVSVAKAIRALGQECGFGLSIVSFAYFRVGEP